MSETGRVFIYAYGASAGSAARDLVREPPPPGKGGGRLYGIPGGLGPKRGKRRVYVDTSVIGGCHDDEFRDASVALMRAFRAGVATMVVSDVTEEELEAAPERVRKELYSVPAEHREHVLADAGPADQLAAAYLSRGVLPASSLNDAQHIAAATVHGVDALVSWNFKHIVNAGRILGYNAVNLEFGHSRLVIHAPNEEVAYHENQGG